MARVRNLDPGFFTNEELVELPFEFRLLFAGLWTLADREGRLEDRPKRIRMELFPCDAVDCDAGLQALHDAGLVVRYRVDGVAYLWIPKFHDHQRPHPRETPSRIPACPGAPEVGQGRAEPAEQGPEGEPKANPRQTLGKPRSAKGETRLPDSRTLGLSEHGQEQETRAPRRTLPSVDRPPDVAEGHWRDWLAVRKAKRSGPVTETALDGVRLEAAKAGVSLDEAVRISAARSWVGFRADWDWRSTPPSRASPGPPTAADRRAAFVASVTAHRTDRPNHDPSVIDAEPSQSAAPRLAAGCG